jgi:hypothetical protein
VEARELGRIDELENAVAGIIDDATGGTQSRRGQNVLGVRAMGA